MGSGNPRIRSVLVASGLDPSGGAGFVADVRVIERAGFRAVGAITAQTVQDTGGVKSSQPVDPELLEAQLTAVLSDIEVAAVKIGLVPNPGVAVSIARALALTGAPVIWDPVGAPSAGAPFATALGDVAAVLAPEADLITPNLLEAAALTGAPVSSPAAAARTLSGRWRCAVLVKGGHLAGDPVDALARGELVEELAASRVAGPPAHGTGCFLSTAIACELAGGAELGAAVRAARAQLLARLRAPISPGRHAPSVI